MYGEGRPGRYVTSQYLHSFIKRKQNLYTLVVKNPKFVHFVGKKNQNSYTLVVGDALPSPTAVHPWRRGVKGMEEEGDEKS